MSMLVEESLRNLKGRSKFEIIQKWIGESSDHSYGTYACTCLIWFMPWAYI
jgi:hypothetical protein